MKVYKWTGANRSFSDYRYIVAFKIPGGLLDLAMANDGRLQVDHYEDDDDPSEELMDEWKQIWP